MVTLKEPEPASLRRPDKIERILSPNEIHGLPYGIRITNNGHTLTREGSPLIEDTGTRVFLIPSDELDLFYQDGARTQEQLYTFLKTHDIGGRVLSLGNEPVQIPSDLSAWTCIVKWVDHTTRNRWRVPDLSRFSFTQESGIREIITERVSIWNKPEIRVNFSRITRDTMVHIVEPPEAEERKNDIVLLPGVNTLVIDLCRKNVGQIPAPPIDVFVHQNNNMLKMQVVRNNTMYEQVCVAPPEEAARIIRGYPNMTKEKLATISYGVNGISVDGTLAVFDATGVIDVPVLPDGAHSEVILWYNTGSSLQREALVIHFDKTDNGIYGTFERGIEAGTLIDFSKDAAKSRARVVFDIELRAIEEARRLKAMTGETKTQTTVKKKEEPKMSGPRIPTADDVFFS
jgi:hypothetical protein